MTQTNEMTYRKWNRGKRISKKYEIIACNDWGNWLILFEGSEAECQAEYNENIGHYEEKEASVQNV